MSGSRAGELVSQLRIPGATYRLQLSLSFRFSDARDLVPYLHELGITDLYASPRFKARKGSSHGYDVADPHRISSELGTEEDFEELARRLRHYGMRVLLDIVPNHMSASADNPWWMDVLENGPSSPYADYFDIEWHPATTKAAFLQENKVLLPVLGDLYGNVLENQELLPRVDEGGFFVRYHEHRFPLDPKSYGVILESVLENRPPTAAGARDPFAEVSSLLEAVAGLPPFTAVAAEERERRHRESREIKERTWRLYHSNPEIKKSIDEALRRLSGAKDDAASFTQLARLLEAQPYRVAHWKIALEEINYRRFFDINELVGLRVEEPKVFTDRHRVILQLVREGAVSGLRVDHVDGLRDPLGYLQLLQRSVGRELGLENAQNIYLIVEKVLGERESLPEEWPICGSTGYDFLNAVNALFLDPGGLQTAEETYARFTDSHLPFAEVCYAGNKKVMQALFGGEVQALTHHLAKLAAQDRRARDLPLYELVQLLVEVTACLPVYRTYLRGAAVSQRDRGFLEKTLDMARRRAPAGSVSDAALAFLRQVFLLDPPAYAPEQRDDYLRFVMRWQQFTGPVMAKGLEDTAFYVHNSLVSLNEVGGDPLRGSLPLEVEAFHLFNLENGGQWPHSLNATSTHDTKRSEDVRARINVISEMPEEWEACLFRWSRWNSAKKTTTDGHPSPAPDEEAFLYQTMLGAWPLDEGEVPAFAERLKACVVKSAREAKLYTSWIEPNLEHEAGLERFVGAILDQGGRNRFLTDFLRLQGQVAFYGALNSLSQVVLKIGSPGVPDFYQGSELWDFSLVDPDNRRPVDFASRARRLEELKAAEGAGLADLAAELLCHWKDGRIKLFTIWKALEFRRRFLSVFQSGEYVPLAVSGRLRNQVCAFLRRKEKDAVLVVVPRLLRNLVSPGQPPVGRGVWRGGTVVLPPNLAGAWQNAFTGRILAAGARTRAPYLRLRDVFETLPFALLGPVTQ